MNCTTFETTRCRGVTTLSITVVLLMVVTLLTLSSSRVGFLELLVADGYESRNNAFNQSDSALDALLLVLEKDEVVKSSDPPGRVYCTDHDAKLGDDCDPNTKIESDNGLPGRFVDARHQLQIIYQGDRPAPRGTAIESTTSLKFSHYLLRSIYDDTANKGGVSETVMAVMDEPYPSL